jgi:hypothetical protein
MRRPLNLFFNVGLIIGLFVAAVAVSALALDLLFPSQVTVHGFISPVREGFYSWRGRPYAASPVVRMSITLPALPEDERLTSVEVLLENNLPTRVAGRLTIILYAPGFVVIAQGGRDVELASRETRSVPVTLSWMEGKYNRSIWAMKAEFSGIGRRFF